MINFLRRGAVRLPLIAIAAVAWLAVSNHCAIAALEGAAKMPMASCHGAAPSQQAPAKGEGSGVECCKVLRATLSGLAKSLRAGDTLAFDPMIYAVGMFVAPAVQIKFVLPLDTGPPDALSFSESVLQRSILAHAPPCRV